MAESNGSNWTLWDSRDGAEWKVAHPEGFWLHDPCRSFEFFICSVAIGSVCLVGLVGNILSFAVLGNDRQNRVATFLLRFVAVADSSLLIVSVFVLSSVLGPYQIPSTRPALRQVIPYMKKYVNPFGPITQSFTIWMTVLLAVNRYVAVCKPFAAKRLLTLRKAQIQVAAVVFLSVAFNVPRFFQYGIVYRLENNVTVPRKQLTALGSDVTFDIGYFNVFYNIVILVLPLVALVVFNTRIIWDMHISKSKMKKNSLNYSGQPERNITIVMLIIILKLILFHSPDRVVTAVKIVEVHRNPNLACPHPVIYASHFSNLLVILSSSTDFFIYCVFRERFRRIFCFRFCCFGASQPSSSLRWTTHGLERLPSLCSSDSGHRTSLLPWFGKRKLSTSSYCNTRLLGHSISDASRKVSRQESLTSRNGDAKHCPGDAPPVLNGITSV